MPLFPVSGRVPIGVYIQQLVRSWNFTKTQALAKATTKHEGMLLGNLWLVLAPALQALGFYLIFGVILQTSRGIENFPAYLVIGVFLFGYTSRSVSNAAGIINANKGLIQAFAFPRMALVLSAVVRDALSLVPALVVMIGFVVLNPPGAAPTSKWLLLPIVLVLQTIFNFGLALIVARLTDWIPDIRHLISFLTRFWFYLSGVFFSIERFVSHPTLQQAMENNPAYVVLKSARNLLIYNTLPDEGDWARMACWALGALLLGFVYFWQGETTYGRQ